jgi:type IV pilus assembly protein PilO
MVGALLGLLASGGAWHFLSGDRAALAELKAANGRLDAEVKRGAQVKADYEALKDGALEQEKRIAEMVALMPLEGERARVAQMVQKLASASALGQVQSWSADKPTKSEYYTEYPTVYKYSGGFHEFGKFLSLVSGLEKTVNISDIVMTRETGRAAGSATIEFRLSIYVYAPDSAGQDKVQAQAQTQAGAAQAAEPGGGRGDLP